MSHATDRGIARLLQRLAAVAAILVTLVPPVGYLLTEIREIGGSLAADARNQAALVSRAIARNPGVWRFAHERLRGVIGEVRDPARRTVILDDRGTQLDDFPVHLLPPVLEREAEVYDYGARAGAVRVSASLADALVRAALVLALSSAVGYLVYFPLRRIPLAALRGATERLMRSEARNRTVVSGLREGVLLLDEQLQVIAANPGASRILDMPEADLIGRDLSAFRGRMLDGAGNPLPQAQWPSTLALETGLPQAGIAMGVKREGQPILWLDVNAQAVPYDEGESRAVVVSFEDRTAVVEMNHRLELIDRAVQSTSDAIFVADAQQRLVSANRAFFNITGLDASEVIGRTFEDVWGGEMGSDLHREMTAAVNAAGSWRGELWSCGKDGRRFAAWLNISAVPDPAGRGGHIVGTFSDITERILAEERIRNMARHDPLTGLPNRAMLRESLARILASARRRGCEAGVLFIDLDHFKSVNDSLGHAAGDHVLVEVGRRLREVLREEDLLSRLAGDEFVLVVPELAQSGDAAAVADKILKRLSEPYTVGEREFLLTPSIGISVFPSDGQDVDSLLSNADTAMYSAKENGRAGFRFFAPAMNHAVTSRLEIATEVRRGLERHEFVLYYQPQVEAQTGLLCGVEALIRWNHPARGLVSPGYFIPVVEGSRLIIEIGDWVLREAVRQSLEWRERGLCAVPIAVNISPLQFKQDDFVAGVVDCVGSAALSYGAIELELTENLMVDDPEGTRLKMQTLKDMGLGLSLDDFGTGYSSLAYLTRFPFDKLKIDQSFVRRMLDDATTLSIVEAIIALAHAVKLDVLAEGVETTEEAAQLRRKGCDQFQGYVVAKPMPAAAFEGWLALEGVPAAAAACV